MMRALVCTSLEVCFRKGTLSLPGPFVHRDVRRGHGRQEDVARHRNALRPRQHQELKRIPRAHAVADDLHTQMRAERFPVPTSCNGRLTIASHMTRSQRKGLLRWWLCVRCSAQEVRVLTFIGTGMLRIIIVNPMAEQPSICVCSSRCKASPAACAPEQAATPQPCPGSW